MELRLKRVPFIAPSTAFSTQIALKVQVQ
jgi:hypothetical protein